MEKIFCNLCGKEIVGSPVKTLLTDDCDGSMYEGVVDEDCANYIEDCGYNLKQVGQS